jgi:amino-acid N-acetyltransferase
MIGAMQIRKARMSDALAICEIVNYHAERGRMLHISLESTYERLRNFLVADENGQVVGCAAVEIAWADLAEIRSVAVSPTFGRRGIGRALVQAAVGDALAMGVRRLFSLTYEKDFFEHCGFHVIDRQELPTKVWRVCIACPRRTACDEIAMMLVLDPAAQEAPGEQQAPIHQEALEAPPRQERSTSRPRPADPAAT